MRKKIKKLGLMSIILFLFSYLINFVWESFHAVFLYQDHNFSSQKYVLMINYVSIMDGLLILGMYLLTASIIKDILWIKDQSMHFCLLDR